MGQSYISWALERYRGVWAESETKVAGLCSLDELQRVRGFQSFVGEHPEAFERNYVPGHFTGSALITTPQFDKVLLTHHAKLNMWIQLGGHLDGEREAYRGAYREAEEESGLKDLKFSQLSILNVDGIPLPFDIDCHDIPERKNEPDHQHYDLRYLFVTEHPEEIAVSDESLDLKWFSIEEARSVTKELSMHRQFDKLEYLATSF